MSESPSSNGPRILTTDIETSPSLGYVWSLWQQNLGLNQLEKVTEVMCFAAKWLHVDEVEFYSTHHDGKAEMVAQAHRLLDEADVVVHFNGRSFDVPHLNREFLLAGLTPPSPYKQVDLLHVAKKNFRFLSNKLQHITEQLDLSGKLSHTGFQMWKDAIAGDGPAWKLFKEYNIQDVRTTEELYLKLLPWIQNHPHHALYNLSDDDCCSRCGKTETLQRRGFAYTPLGKYQQFVCKVDKGGCGSWSRSKKNLAAVGSRAVVQ
jgi:hypothetical protein